MNLKKSGNFFFFFKKIKIHKIFISMVPYGTRTLRKIIFFFGQIIYNERNSSKIYPSSYQRNPMARKYVIQISEKFFSECRINYNISESMSVLRQFLSAIVRVATPEPYTYPKIFYTAIRCFRKIFTSVHSYFNRFLNAVGTDLIAALIAEQCQIQ